MLWFLLLWFVPGDRVAVDHVDVCELNHVVLVPGAPHNAYWVWWRLHEVDGHTDYYVADWRIESDVPAPIEGVQEFWDSRSKLMRRVISQVQEETWSTFDREAHDRRRLPVERRQRLRDGWLLGGISKGSARQ